MEVQRHYQILDVSLTLRSAGPAFLDDFDEDYLRFRLPGPGTGRPLDIAYLPPGPDGPARLQVDGRVQVLEDQRDPLGFANFVVHGILMDAVRDFTVLHAAVLERGGRAMAVCGPSGAGKTTLTLDLLAQGLGFLSDDFCPLGLRTGLVHPFPRSLWVREAGADESRSRHAGKRQMRPERGAFRLVDHPCPLSVFLYLDKGLPEQGPSRFHVRLRQEGAGPLLEGFGSVPGVEIVRPDPGRPDDIHVVHPRDGAVVDALRTLLEAHADGYWTCSGIPGGRPDFEREPVLTPMPSHEAAFLLARERKQQRFRGEDGSIMGPGAALAHLNHLLGGVACYRLTAGWRERRLELALGVLDIR